MKEGRRQRGKEGRKEGRKGNIWTEIGEWGLALEIQNFTLNHCNSIQSGSYKPVLLCCGENRYL
jgi:hypothetical protein